MRKIISAGLMANLAGGCLLWLVMTATAIAQPLRLNSPNRLAFMPSGHILVSDHRLKGVAAWNSRRQELMRVVRIPGRVSGIAVGWNRIFVGNERTQSVDVHTLGGRYRYVLGGADGQVRRPSDIALDIRRGLVFVSDPGSGKVWVYDYRGPLLRTLPAPGEPVKLHQPTGLTVDPERDEVLVSDFGKAGSFSMKAWVRIYDYDGFHLDSISGSRGTSDFRFSRPQGIVLNGEGYIFLVDSLRGQVLVFDRDTLQGVRVIGELGRGPGQLFLPLDVLIDDRAGTLYVSNNRNARIEVFSGAGALP